MIKVRNLSFSYNANDEALRDVSLEISKGSWVSILGHNGSGKSTLSKCLVGLLSPSAGEIHIDDMLLNNENLPKIRRMMGIVFQNPEIQLFSSTVEDELIFGAENLCIEKDEIEKRLKEILTLTGIEDLRLQNPGKLSGGEQQLVAIASVLMMDPEILLLDEVMSWVDKNNRIKIKSILTDLKNKGKTIVMVDHIDENIEFADRIIKI